MRKLLTLLAVLVCAASQAQLVPILTFDDEQFSFTGGTISILPDVLGGNVDTNEVVLMSTNSAKAYADVTFAPLTGTLIATDGEVPGDFNFTGLIGFPGGIDTDSISVTSWTGADTGKVLGIGALTNATPATAEMLTNTWGIFDDDATKYVGGDGALHAMTESVVTNALGRAISGPGIITPIITDGATVTSLGSFLSTGDAEFVDVKQASQIVIVSDAVTIAHATNGVAGERCPPSVGAYEFWSQGRANTPTLRTGNWRGK